MPLIPIETLALFFVAAVGLSFAPGPDNIFVLTQSALYGKVAGLLVTLGLCTGLLVHTGLVSVGVAAIFQTSALAFTILKGGCKKFCVNRNLYKKEIYTDDDKKRTA